VLDKATGELVEKSSYLAYGAKESDYRTERWKGFREDYGFTGKEEDVEVGLVYFGKRFLSPQLGRWVSPDPLAVHAPGEADLNLYAYVSGAVLKNVDPVGLKDTEAPVDKTPDQVEVQAIIDNAVTQNQLDGCGENASCGPTKGEREIANSSNILNHPPNEGEVKKANANEAYSRKMAAYDKPIQPVPLVDMVLGSAALKVGRSVIDSYEMATMARVSSAMNSSLSSAAEGATAPVAKFSDYIFKEGATHGKDAVFRGLGYGKEQSGQLAQMWEQQAAARFAKGEYTLGKLDQYGQRINIEIQVPGIGDAAGKVSNMQSGWMIQPGGGIKLNTPFSGFTR
jgi:RHS repeat-associated protein